jgi:hypothetical protein
MAFAALRQAGEARIIQMYALKLSAATVCLAPHAVAAAVLALCDERQAALVAFRQIMRAAERDQRRRVSAALRKRRAPISGRPPVSSLRLATQFRQAGRFLCGGRKRRPGWRSRAATRKVFIPG